MDVALAKHSENLGMLFTDSRPGCVSMIISRRSRSDEEIAQIVREYKVLWTLCQLLQGQILHVNLRYKIVDDVTYDAAVKRLMKPVRS